MHLNQRFTKTNLFFGHVQQTHGVTLTQQVGSHGVERFVELSLDVCQLLKHLTGRPEQHLEPHKAARFPAQHEASILSGGTGENTFLCYELHSFTLPDSSWTPR